MLVLPSTRAQTLYTADLGTLPEAQGWSYAGLGPVTEMLAGNSVLLDTTASTSTEAGWGNASAGDLNRTNGFTLLIHARVNTEAHTSVNRAGFSLIVLGDDKHGIELGFWTNTIFAQTDTPLFTHGEDVSFSTTNAFVTYALTLLATNYILAANGVTILTGPIRNYTAFNGFPNPYSTPNFIFMGDDTTSAAGSENIGWVALIQPPKLAIAAPGIVSWTGVSNQTYTVLAGTNLTSWGSAGAATSANNSFRFTNSIPANQFFRVVYP